MVAARGQDLYLGTGGDEWINGRLAIRGFEEAYDLGERAKLRKDRKAHRESERAVMMSEPIVPGCVRRRQGVDIKLGCSCRSN